MVNNHTCKHSRMLVSDKMVGIVKMFNHFDGASKQA